MNEWEVFRPYKKHCYLHHITCSWFAFRDFKNLWRCPACSKVAPKEVGLFADLCFCNPLLNTAKTWYSAEANKNANL